MCPTLGEPDQHELRARRKPLPAEQVKGYADAIRADLANRPAKPGAPKRDLSGGIVPKGTSEPERRAAARRYVKRTQAERARAAVTPEPATDAEPQETPPDEMPW
jgi:hypothetical protein